jgi:hypothetical protein
MSYSLSPDLKSKLSHFIDLTRSGKSPNEALHTRKEYLNPYLLSHIIEYYGIQEYGSNYPADLSPSSIVQHPEEYYDSISDRQKELMQTAYKRGLT